MLMSRHRRLHDAHPPGSQPSWMACWIRLPANRLWPSHIELRCGASGGRRSAIDDLLFVAERIINRNRPSASSPASASSASSSSAGFQPSDKQASSQVTSLAYVITSLSSSSTPSFASPVSAASSPSAQNQRRCFRFQRYKRNHRLPANAHSGDEVYKTMSVGNT